MTVRTSCVKELREKTSAGMLDCKKALEATNGDFQKAVDWLRTKGLSQAAKKAGRTTAEGLIASYIHGDGRIGVLLEVNSETDFVARNQEFKEFVHDIAMHIAAMTPQYINHEDIPEEIRNKERDLLLAKGKEEGKDPNWLDKIVEGQLKKWVADICLLDQSFVKDPKKTVRDRLNETIAKMGENIVIRRFHRWELGQGIEKKTENFAQEVAAQMKG